MALPILSICYSIILCLTLVSALNVSGKISWNRPCPNATSLGRAKAILDGGKYAGSVTQSGGFTIYNVPEGTYILSVVSHDHVFDQVRVDVQNSSPEPEVRPYVPGTPLNPPSPILLPYPIVLSPKERLAYFSPPDSFSIVSMLSNPMMMMMVVGGAMVMAMPYLIKNLDPEALEELKENQAKMAGVQNAFTSGDIKGGLSAIMSAVDEAQSEASPGGKTPKKARGGPGSGKKTRR